MELRDHLRECLEKNGDDRTHKIVLGTWPLSHAGQRMVIKNCARMKYDLYFCYLTNYVECGALAGSWSAISLVKRLVRGMYIQLLNYRMFQNSNTNAEKMKGGEEEG